MSKNSDVTSETKVKEVIKGIIKIISVLSALALIILLILKIVIVPKTPVTSQQMWNIMVENGYEPKDITKWYYENDKNFKDTLIKCIAFEKNDIHFEFYDFVNRNCATDVFAQLYSQIRRSKDVHYNITTHKDIANYCIYTIDDYDTYNVAIFVENTVVYAYSNSESKNDINILLDAIDYLN